MLSGKFVSRAELLTWIKKEVAIYCNRNQLPILPVRYGTVPVTAKAIFAYPPPMIEVWQEYSKWLSPYLPYHRVWHVHHSLFHELWHYRQCLFALSQRKRITLDVFNENDAYTQGDTKADEILSNMSIDEINPILPEIGSAMIAGVGLGLGFKGVELLTKQLRKKNPPYLIKKSVNKWVVIDTATGHTIGIFNSKYLADKWVCEGGPEYLARKWKKNPTEPHPIYATPTKKFSGMMYKLYKVFEYRNVATREQLLLKRDGYKTRIFMVADGWAIYYRR